MATTPVFLPGESHGQRSLGGYSPRGRKQSDMTEHARSSRHSPLVAPENALKHQARPPGLDGILPGGIANNLSMGHAGLRVHC